MNSGIVEISLHFDPSALSKAPAVSLAISENPVIMELLDVACDILEDVTRFVIVLGRSAWPVDVRTDMSVFLEQLGPLFAFLQRGGGEFRLSMYEQGTEADIVIEVRDGFARLRCESFGAGSIGFDASVQLVSVGSLVDRLAKLRDDFLSACESVCPKLLSYPAFVEWIAATTLK